MASYTEKLNLLKKNPVTDGADTFNIETMMNENWDKIDGFSAFLEASIAPPYSASSAYAVGAWCTYYGKLYQCTTAIGSGGEAWNANHWTAKNATDLAKDAVKTFARPNLLDNWYFVGGGSQQGGGQFPINQRGQTSYSSSGYGIDRWYTDHYGSSNSITLSSNGLSFASGVRFSQKHETPNFFDGRRACVSILLASGVFGWSSMKLGKEEGGIRLCGGKVSVFSTSDAGTLLWTNESVTIAAVKLELGDTQTLAHQDENGDWVLNEIPNYTEQLLRCSSGEQIDGADSGTTLPLYRQEAFVPSDTVPTINGAINWTYV